MAKVKISALSAATNPEVTLSRVVAIPVGSITKKATLQQIKDLFDIPSLTGYLTSATAATTYQPIGSYLTGITSLQVTTALGFTPYDSANPSGYITSSALSGYLTSATASTTYQAILVSGISIKTINSNSLLGSGDITIGASLSAITAATATNTINNASYAQEWQWNTMSGNGLKLTSSSTVNTNGASIFEINKTGTNGLNISTYGLKITHLGSSSGTHKSAALLLQGGHAQGVSALQTGDMSTTATITNGADINIGNNGVINWNNSSIPPGAATIKSLSLISNTTGAVEIYSAYGTYMRGGLVGTIFQEAGGALNIMSAIGYKNSYTQHLTFGMVNTNANTTTYQNLASTTPGVIERDADCIKISAGSGITAYSVFNPVYQFVVKGATNNIGIGTVTPNPSCKLDIESTTQGLGLSNMTATQASAISTPKKSLMIYVTNTNGTFTSAGWWGYNGTIWKLMLAE